MDFKFTPELEAFRQEVRAWIAANVPGDYGTPAWPMPKDEAAALAESRKWARTLHSGGWSGITWPKEYGGRGASPIEGFIFQDELANHRVPGTIDIIGIGMAGPTIMSWGTPEQKARFLPKILSGEEIWCQGFSEPNAGSDVAGIKTTAIDAGDHYVVNGQKIWTSVAHHADWLLLVTRTDPGAERHKGLTYLVVDMKTPGLEVRPLRQITGDSEFNELFFTDMKVPKANILGKEGQGWMVAITTLMHERVNIAALLYMRVKQALRDVVELTRTIKRNGRPMCEDPVTRKKLVKYYTVIETLRLSNLRMRANLAPNSDPGPIGSIFKLIFSDVNMAMLEMPVDILGPYAEQLPGSAAHNKHVDQWMKWFLRSRANSIEGGTSEVLRGIISERVLGLPR